MESTTTLDTADFVEMVNNLFDSLNSKSKFDPNPYNCALSRGSKSMETLEAAIPYFLNLKKILFRTPKRRVSARLDCFDGMVQTIHGILALFDSEEKSSSKPTFLLTNRLNQDPPKIYFRFSNKAMDITKTLQFARYEPHLFHSWSFKKFEGIEVCTLHR